MYKSLEFDQDPIAIGAFSAVLKGIPVVCAAGNTGPTASSVFLTVAAGSVNRSFPADVQLLKGPRVVGETLTQATNSSSKPYPLLYSEEQQHCDYSAEDSSIAGKIVVCEANGGLADKSIIRDLRSAAAGGVVLINADINGYTTVLRDYGPGVMQVTAADEINITDYATLTNNHSAATFTFNNTEILVRSSPTVASFSGRGPTDILAPGLNILAAWPPLGMTAVESFNIISGTSMAMPHTSGIAALVKSAHPDWSPVAIKSAILTTSDAVDKNGKLILDEQRKRAGAHATGAEHVNPTRAADPGVVYDLGVPEYAGYICALLGDRALATIVRNSSLSCSGLLKTPEVQLNYPTITVPLQPTPFTVNRTVTNVGPAESTYMVKVDVPGSLTVHISPLTLVFSRAGEKKTFSVTVSGQGADGQAVVDGSLSWVSGNHVVRSPIVAIFGLARPRLMS
uniref:Subtilisin-like protease fibronectin type-III domain-containing protein n=1 Tax=Setaria italica TaxID=4555 RepID=K4ALB7_SETIT